MEKCLDRLEGVLDFGGIRKDVFLLIFSGIFLLISIISPKSLPFHPSWVAILLCGLPIICEAIIGLIRSFDIKADVLVSIALVAAIISGEHFAAGEVAFIMQLGALLEDLTVSKARAGIEKLIDLSPRTARVLRNDDEQIIPSSEVLVGDIIRVLPGETIPVDGVIISGQTSIDQAVMTGESLPVDKVAGDSVSSGTLNQLGAFHMEATQVGDNSSIQRMIRLVQSADASKAKIVGLADRWATWIVVVALLTAALTWFFTGEMLRAVTVLVVFCPCALVLATPTAIMAAIGNATKHGFLVREGDALERLASIERIAFDKTGTLTHGVAEVVATEVVDNNVKKEELWLQVASSEILSEHPLGKALVRGFRGKYSSEISLPDDFRMIPSKGVSATVDGKQIYSGNASLLQDMSIPIPNEVSEKAQGYSMTGATIIYVVVDGNLAGFFALADTVREESKQLISDIKRASVIPILLTGDHPDAAHTIARNLDIDQVHAECLPETKLQYIDQYQEYKTPVCMIGDGINDAPALKKSHVGIAMGGIGSDIAIDAADIVLVDDEITQLPHLLALSKRMMTSIKINMVFSLVLNFAAIGLAVTGILNPVMGALVHNAGSIVVIINSALLLNWRSNAKTPL